MSGYTRGSADGVQNDFIINPKWRLDIRLKIAAYRLRYVRQLLCVPEVVWRQVAYVRLIFDMVCIGDCGQGKTFNIILWMFVLSECFQVI